MNRLPAAYAVGRRLTLLAVLLLACGLAPAAWESAAAASDAAAPTLSLSDLEAALEEDDLEELTTGEAIRAQLPAMIPLVGLFAIAIWSFFANSRWMKYLVLVASVGYLGFYRNSLVSVVDIFGLLRGRFPALEFGLGWYVIGIFTVLTTVLWGRLYCGRICAFGAFTQLLDKIVPAALRVDVPPAIEKRAAYIKYGLLFGVVGYFLVTDDLLVYRYVEPFWMFTFKGNTLMWTLLGLLLVATVFVRNLYCRFLCPLGAALGLISKLTLFPIKRWKECGRCKICERICEWGAIEPSGKIIAAECVRCDDCERKYDDKAGCPHWLLLAKRERRLAGIPVTVGASKTEKQDP